MFFVRFFNISTLNFLIIFFSVKVFYFIKKYSVLTMYEKHSTNFINPILYKEIMFIYQYSNRLFLRTKKNECFFLYIRHILHTGVVSYSNLS